MKIGNNDIDKIYVGNIEADAVYLGTEKVYSTVDYSTSFTEDSLTMWFTYNGADFICKDNTVFDKIGSVLPEGFPLNGEFFTGNLSIYKEGNDEALYSSPLTEVSMNKVGDGTYIRMAVDEDYKDTLGLRVVDDCYHLQEFGSNSEVFTTIETSLSEGDNIRIEITDISEDGGMWYPTMSQSEPIEILRFYGTEVVNLGAIEFGISPNTRGDKWKFDDLPEYQTGDDEYTVPIASELSLPQVYVYPGRLPFAPATYYDNFVNLFTSGSALVYNHN